MSDKRIRIKLSADEVMQLHRAIEVGALYVDELITLQVCAGEAWARGSRTKWKGLPADLPDPWGRAEWVLMLAGIARDIWPPGGDERRRSASPIEVSMSRSHAIRLLSVIEVGIGHFSNVHVEGPWSVRETLKRLASLIGVLGRAIGIRRLHDGSIGSIGSTEGPSEGASDDASDDASEDGAADV